MKALRLQLCIVLCAILSISQLNGQPLSITCPDGTPVTLPCIDDVPFQAGDSLGFLSLEGAAIEGVTGNLTIVYSDFASMNTGCNDDPINITRTFRFTDESESAEIMCNVRFQIRRSLNVDELECDDITVTLEETGSVNLAPSDVNYTFATECGEDLIIGELDIEEFFCNDILNNPIENVLNATNTCGEAVNCTFSVTVVDNIPPLIECPNDISITLDPCTCESEVEFQAPVVSDMCTTPMDITISRTDMTGLNSGDFFPVGQTEISYQAEDRNENISDCSFNIIIESSDPGTLVCKGAQNISLNQDCEAAVTPAMLVSDPECDINTYTVTLFDPVGNILVDNIIPGEFLGMTITATASYECFDNSCDVELFVEDKMPPDFDCSDMTVSCGEALAFEIPEISDNCDNASAVLLNSIIEDVSCDNATIDKIVTRTYGLYDGNGMEISTCDQRLLIMKFDIDEVEAPKQDTSIYCGADYLVDENGNPDPSVTGAPMLDGVALWPPDDLLCNVSLAYVDSVLPSIPCVNQIIREWTVLNWYCGSDGMENFIQYISLIDTVAPVFDCPPNVTISSAAMSCETMYAIPAIDAVDACQADVIVDIAYPGGFSQGMNGIDVELPLGDNDISYRVRDVCGRQASCTYTVTVNDNVEPVAICESGLQFAIGGGGTVELLATTFDNGSLDECDLATVEIARMDDACGIDGNTEFGPSITLCCEDIGSEVMVILEVTDASGNTNRCMSGITVFDEVEPAVISGLPDITISNDFPIDTANLDTFGIIEINTDAPAVISLDAVTVDYSGPAINGVVLDNCDNAIIEESVSAELGMCGLGTINRSFEIMDAYGNMTSMQQEITVVLAAEFTEDSITWPEDLDLMNTCATGIDPSTLNSFPIYDEMFNTRVSHTFKDDTVAFINEGCYIIDRNWFVSDWCNRTDAGTFVLFQDTQQITISNNIEPIISSACTDTLICSFVSACGPHPISISVEGSDDCTPLDSLQWTLEIFYEGSSVADTTHYGNTYDGTLPVGVNRIVWTLDDGCGNTDVCEYDFEIESCLNPQPICRTELEFNIIEFFDIDQGTEFFVGARVTPDMIDGGSKDPCGDELSLSFSEDVNDTVRIYECSDLGMQTLSLYATNTDGKFDFCNVNIEIVDTNAIQFCTGTLATINGVVFGNGEDFVRDVKVNLSGTDLFNMTDENGFFSFPAMEMGGTYEVIPSKSDEALRGVTTSDLVLIQQHILGVNSFESPYKLIAADVNQSNDVSAADLIAIRKLILGRIDEFTTGKSWAFIPGDHVFVDPSNPWGNGVPEQYEIPNLNTSMDLNFIGVKLGDVNESVEMNGLYTTARTVETFMYGSNRSAKNRLEVRADKDMVIAGLKLRIDYDATQLEIENVKSNLTGMDFDHHEAVDGSLILLASDYEMNSIRKGDVMFAIDFENELTINDYKSINIESKASEVAYASGMSANVYVRYESDLNKVQLKQNTPNPWTEQTQFEVVMPASEEVLFQISDVSGKLIVSKKIQMTEGLNSVVVEKADFPSIGGLFFYEIKSSHGTASKKMMLLSH